MTSSVVIAIYTPRSVAVTARFEQAGLPQEPSVRRQPRQGSLMASTRTRGENGCVRSRFVLHLSMMICSIPGCGKKKKSWGFCSAHAERYRRHGDPLGLGHSAKRKSGRDFSTTLTCLTCNELFHPWGGRLETSRYCSVKCSQPARILGTLNTTEDFDRLIAKTESGCWEWTGPLKWSGYGTFGFGGRLRLAHRFSYERTKGPIPAGLFVCHTCDNRKCVNPDHLWIGTHADNMADKIAKDRGYKGPSLIHSEKHPLSKLDTAAARAIRGDSRPAHAIAAEYGVSKSLVWGIKKGTHWKYA